MPSPESALTTLRPDLAESFMEFDLEANRLGFIAQRVLPIIEVAKQAGQFGKIPIEELLQARDTARAPGSGYSRSEWTFDKATYACEEHGAEEPIDDSERMMFSDFFDAEQIAAMRAFEAVLGNAEARVAALIFNTTTWTGSALTTGITNEWDDAAQATPIADVKAAKKKVFDGSGLWPNAIIMNQTVFNNLKSVDEIQSLSQSQSFMDVRPGAMGALSLAVALDIDEIIIAGSAKNTANENQTVSIAHHWSDEYVMVCRVARTSDFREPAIGRIFHWGEDGSTPGGTVETYREEKVRSDIYRVRHQVDEIVTYAEAGHLLTNATT